MYVERISECGVRQIIWDQIQRRLNVGDFGCQLPNLLFPAGLTLLHDWRGIWCVLVVVVDF